MRGRLVRAAGAVAGTCPLGGPMGRDAHVEAATGTARNGWHWHGDGKQSKPKISIAYNAVITNTNTFQQKLMNLSLSVSKSTVRLAASATYSKNQILQPRASFEPCPAPKTWGPDSQPHPREGGEATIARGIHPNAPSSNFVLET